MTLWRLEWTRTIRTASAFVLPGLFVFLAILGPVTARYLPSLLERYAEQITIILPEPTPLEGLAQYLGNVEQLGLAGIVFVAAMAVSIDAKRELSVFFRSRKTVRQLLAPRITVPLALGVVSVWLGSAVAYVTTLIVLGRLPAAEVAVGTALYCAYLIFAVAVVVYVSSLAKPVPIVAIVSLVALILTGVAGLLPKIGDWLPSALIGATVHLAAGGEWMYTMPLLLTAASSVILVALGLRRLEQREI